MESQRFWHLCVESVLKLVSLLLYGNIIFDYYYSRLHTNPNQADLFLQNEKNLGNIPHKFCHISLKLFCVQQSTLKNREEGLFGLCPNFTGVEQRFRNVQNATGNSLQTYTSFSTMIIYKRCNFCNVNKRGDLNEAAMSIGMQR